MNLAQQYLNNPTKDINPALQAIKWLTSCPLIIQDAREALQKGKQVRTVLDQVKRAVEVRTEISFRLAWEQGQVYKNRIKRDKKKKQ